MIRNDSNIENIQLFSKQNIIKGIINSIKLSFF
jgi:hypothetical protein